MEMRAIEDIAIGEDLTPPLHPLAVVLRDSALSSHCSACFSTLPAQPFLLFTPAIPQNPHHVPSDSPTPLYCCPDCSSYDSPLHLSSGEAHLLSIFIQSPPATWNDSSDLRLSLRLVSIFQNLPQKYIFSPRFSMSSDQQVFLGGIRDSPSQENENIEGPADYLENNEDPWEKCCQNGAVIERVVGLMTNREKLVFLQNRNNPDEDCGNCENSDENDEILERIREGAKMVAKARRMCLDEDVNVDKQEDFLLEEMVLCLVLTNAVEIQDKSGCSVGVAVYNTAFSCINHSCSPNACYRFLVGLEDNVQSPLRITSAAKVGCGNNDLMVEGDGEKNGYGPRVIVRSIKDVKKGEEVTIAYTDLLQPKEMRRAELWFKYRFNCSCKRCCAVPATYVDNALQVRLGIITKHPLRFGALSGKNPKVFENCIQTQRLDYVLNLRGSK